jgi:hypothetical protein
MATLPDLTAPQHLDGLLHFFSLFNDYNVLKVYPSHTVACSWRLQQGLSTHPPPSDEEHRLCEQEWEAYRQHSMSLHAEMARGHLLERLNSYLSQNGGRAHVMQYRTRAIEIARDRDTSRRLEATLR